MDLRRNTVGKVGLLLMVLLGVTPLSFAEEPVRCAPSDSPVSHPRVLHASRSFSSREYPFTVLLPPEYSTSSRRYPVLYLLHGGTGQGHESWTARSDLIEFTSALPDDQQAIVVMPEGGLAALWADWPDGVHLFESFLIHELIPTVDGTYRTVPERNHRSIAGLSSGGLGAALFAARYSDLFGALGGFSGAYWLEDPVVPPVSTFLSTQAFLNDCGYTAEDLFGPYGPRPTNEEAWRNASPVNLVANLHDTTIYLASGTGVPCPDEVGELVADPTTAIEAAIPYRHTRRFDRALSAAGVAHVTHIGCGIHTWRHWQAALHEFWLLRAP